MNSYMKITFGALLDYTPSTCDEPEVDKDGENEPGRRLHPFIDVKE